MTLATLQNKVYLLTKTNSSGWGTSQVDLNAALNNALERVVQIINAADSRWQWDDNNQTDLPIATTTIMSGQKDYSLSTAHLSIDRVEVQDAASNWRLLKAIDQHDVRYTALAQYYATNGTPLEYDKLGSSVFLYPTPNYTLAAALKIYFTRGPVALASASDVPGFNSLFHDLLAYQVAYEYAISNELGSANSFLAAINKKEQDLKDFYGQRSRDERPRLGISTNRRAGGISGMIGSIWGDSNR